VVAGGCTSGLVPLAVLGSIAFFSTFLLSCLTNGSTISLSFKGVFMVIKHLCIALSAFTSGVAINLFSTELLAVQT
jgi:hypothetical protein